MRRREIIAALGGAVAWPLAGRAAATVPVVGLLYAGPSSYPGLAAFEKGLSDLGWREGETVRIERRISDNDAHRLENGAAELAAMHPNVIFAVNTPAVLAIQRHARNIPVVFSNVSDPIEIGAADSLGQPGSNLTGLTTINRELMPKRLELLKQALPDLRRVGYLANPTYALHVPQLDEMEAAAQGIGLELMTAEARRREDIRKALLGLQEKNVRALIVQQHNLFSAERVVLIEWAERARLPAMYPFGVYTDSGGLLSYGADLLDLNRRAAAYIHKILNGATPESLPIERPDKLKLVINLKAVNAIGLTLPASFLARADEVIE